jgi:peptide/nickel transport system substrate-binding protein
VYGTTARVSDLDPAQAWDFQTLEVLRGIHRGLMAFEAGTGRVVPDLAESYTASESCDSFTFRLRRGIRFPDGTALTADVVKWSVDRAARLRGEASWLVTDFVRQVETVDRSTVRFVLKAPTAFFAVLTALAPYFPLSPAVYPADRAIRDPDDLAGGRLAGLGPYTLVSLERGERIVLEASPGYRGARPRIPRVVIRVFPDSASMRLALEAGAIDLASRGFSAADAGDLAAHPGLATLRFDGPQIRYLCFRTSRSAFSDRRLRQAVAALIDRGEIVEGAYRGLHTPLFSMVPRGIEHGSPAFREAYGERPDVARAEALLAEAGFTAEDPLSFELWHAADRYGETEASVAAILEAQLERSAAVRVEVRSADWIAFKDQLARGEMAAWLLGWYPDYPDADDYTAPFAETAKSRGLGIGFSSPELDRWFALERSSADPAERARAFDRIQKAWTEEVPTLPLYQASQHVFATRKLRNLGLLFPLGLDFARIEPE